MNILHITDLHFSRDVPKDKTGKKWTHIEKRLVEMISDKKIDAIAVTGDITSHGDPSEFGQAKKYLLEIAELLSVNREKVFFCSGNHDADTERSGSTFFHYQSFVNEFYGKNGYDFQVKKKDKKTGKKRNFQFVSINTCTETSLQFYDDAVLREEALSQLNGIRDENYGILLLHHQPEVIKSQDIFMKIVNSGKIKLILCGHLHTTEPRLYQVGDVFVVNGIAVTPHLDWIPSGMQLIHLKRNGKIKIIKINI